MVATVGASQGRPKVVPQGLGLDGARSAPSAPCERRADPRGRLLIDVFATDTNGTAMRSPSGAPVVSANDPDDGSRGQGIEMARARAPADGGPAPPADCPTRDNRAPPTDSPHGPLPRLTEGNGQHMWSRRTSMAWPERARKYRKRQSGLVNGDEVPDWVEPLCRSALEFRGGSVSIQVLFDRAAPDLTDRARTFEQVRRYLADHPEVVQSWQAFADWNRGWPSPCLKGCEVGVWDHGYQDVTQHENPVDACADYLCRKAATVLRTPGVDGPTASA